MGQELSRRLRVESLESRQMLAGDVTVSVVAGNLLIKGDDVANQIVVTSGDEAGTYLVRGLEGTMVTLKGADAAAPETGLMVADVRGHVHVDLGVGDDVAWVHDAEFRRGLSIDMGEGTDAVHIGAAPPEAQTLAPETTVAAAADSTSDAFNVNVRGSLLISMGAGDDVVTIAETEANGFIGVATAGGNDQVTIGAVAAPAAAESDLSGGDASLADPPNVRAGLAIDVVLGEGDDSATIADVRALGQIGVGGGLGNDQIKITDAKTAALTLRGGDGDGVDTIDLSAVKAVVAAIGAGAGADVVKIVDGAFAVLSIDLGDGDDKVSLATTTADRALLAGGAGSADQLDKAADVTIKKLVVTGFEIPEGANQGTLPIPKPIGKILGKVVAAIRGRGR